MSKVVRTSDLGLTAEEVWQKIGDFSKLDTWHPTVKALESSTHEGNERRALTLPDGAILLEERTDDGSDPFSYSYTIIEGPLPVKDYQAKISVAATSDGSTITWSSTFEPDGVPEETAKKIVAGIYVDGFKALR